MASRHVGRSGRTGRQIERAGLVWLIVALLAFGSALHRPVAVVVADEAGEVVATETESASVDGGEVVETPTPAPTPEPTPTPTPEPTPEPIVEPAAQAAETDSVEVETVKEVTPTATATPADPIDASLDVTDGKEQTAEPGTEVVYRHKVTNTGDEAVLNVASESSQDWSIELRRSDGTPLVDYDGDGLPDTGPLGTGDARRFDAGGMVPEQAAPGVAEVTTLTVLSSLDPNPTEPAQIVDTTFVMSAAESGGASIEPDNAENAIPGDIVTYTHTVAHVGSANEDVLDVTAASSLGWTIGLFHDTDGTVPLVDTETGKDADGIPDTGTLQKDVQITIYVRVTVPGDAPAGAVDVTTVTATPSKQNAEENFDTATNTTTVGSVISLTIETGDVSFGLVSPDGAAQLSDGSGAFFTVEQAVTISVTSNDDDWTGTCRATENSGTAAGMLVDEGQLQWRPAGTSDANWSAFTTDASGGCLPGGTTGTVSFIHDYRLLVEWRDAPGTFETAVTYEVSP